jgi:hypothetical protein
VVVPVDEAVNFAADGLLANQSLVVVCPLNRFNMYMVRYYLTVNNADANFDQAWQYPAQAADAYTPNFDLAEFIIQSQYHNVKYALIYEFNGYQYFNSTETAQTIGGSLNASGDFRLEESFGSAPNRIFVFHFKA